ncbi:MAG: 50S ribosomal protein L6 [Nanoarchaeota archaeon]|nr:50S ribosomal protein L6 [Nanoarchaeota archaeon]
MKYELMLLEGASARFENGIVSVSKNDRIISKTLDHPSIKIGIDSSKIILSSDSDSRKIKRLINTYKSHINNLLKGLDEVYVYKLKICSSHFPMDVSIKGDKFVIKNFVGERKSRSSKIVGNAKVEINSDVVTVSSYNKEFAGQTAANLENIAKVKNKDRRRFQDGIYMIIKAGVEL